MSARQAFVESLSTGLKSSAKHLEEPLRTTSQSVTITKRKWKWNKFSALETLGHSCDEFPINKSSIQRIRTQTKAESIKPDFKINLPEVVTVHWDGKLWPSLDVRSSKEERLPLLISVAVKEELVAVEKLDSQIMCCDTTEPNRGRFSETKIDKQLLFFASRHLVYKLIVYCTYILQVILYCSI